MALPFLISEINKPQMSTPITIVAPLANLPSTSLKGQLNVSLQGRSLKNELNYTKETYAEFTKSAGVVGDSTGLEFTALNGSNRTAAISTNLKPSTKYGILYYVTSSDLVANFIISNTANDAFPFNSVIPKTVGNQKAVLTTQATITNNRVTFSTSSAETTDKKIKAKEFRLFELDTTEKDSDFTNLTADQLAVKYPYIAGGSPKSTLTARLKATGKNLLPSFDSINEWEVGEISNTTGLNATATNIIRTKNYRNLGGITQHIASTISASYTTSGIVVHYYDANKNFISSLIGVGSVAFTPPSNAVFFRMRFRRTDSANIADLATELTNAKPMIEKGTIATAYEKYTYTEAYLPAIGGRLVNPTNGQTVAVDELSMGADGNWYKTIRLKEIVLQASDIVGVGNSTNVTKAWTNVFTDNKTFDSGSNLHLEVWGKSRTTSATSDDVNNVGKFYGFTDQRIYFVLPLGTTLADAKTQLAGLVLSYQLAQEIKTQIEGISQLIAEPNGTIIIDNACKETAVYTTNLTIPNTTVPIKTLEKVTKITINADNSRTETDIAISTCTVAGDGLSFTSSSLVSGDLVEYIYQYDSSLSTLCSLTYSYPMNIKAQVESNTKSIASNSQDIVENNDFTVAMLLELASIPHVLSYQAENLSTDTDISRMLLYVPTGYKFTIIAARVISHGSAVGVNDTNTSVFSLTDGTNTIISKTYNTANTFPTNNNSDDLGSPNATYKTIASGGKLVLNVTNGTTADLPAFMLQVRYSISRG